MTKIETRIEQNREIVELGSQILDRARKAEQKVSNYEVVIGGLLEYRKRNSLNFQLEKLDDYLHELQRIMQGHK
jgi:hypothetical protein